MTAIAVSLMFDIMPKLSFTSAYSVAAVRLAANQLAEPVAFAGSGL